MAGRLQIKLVNQDGISINGIVTAKRMIGGEVRSCSTSVGVCTLGNIPPGIWIITARIGSVKAGPIVKSVKSGRTSRVTIQKYVGVSQSMYRR